MTLNPWKRYTLNTSTYTAIDDIVVYGSGSINVTYFTEDGTEFLVANDELGTNAYTVPEDVTITEIANIKDETAFYAKATTGTPVLVVKLSSAII